MEALTSFSREGGMRMRNEDAAKVLAGLTHDMEDVIGQNRRNNML
jgi:hypothetical protein